LLSPGGATGDGGATPFFLLFGSPTAAAPPPFLSLSMSPAMMIDVASSDQCHERTHWSSSLARQNQRADKARLSEEKKAWFTTRTIKVEKGKKQ
ncbi:hypothetical protein LINGRAHAP2_LOCUS20108, partial [Linum grandiflorum]